MLLSFFFLSFNTVFIMTNSLPYQLLVGILVIIWLSSLTMLFCVCTLCLTKTVGIILPQSQSLEINSNNFGGF